MDSDTLQSIIYTIILIILLALYMCTNVKKQIQQQSESDQKAPEQISEVKDTKSDTKGTNDETKSSVLNQEIEDSQKPKNEESKLQENDQEVAKPIETDIIKEHPNLIETETKDILTDMILKKKEAFPKKINTEEVSSKDTQSKEDVDQNLETLDPKTNEKVVIKTDCKDDEEDTTNATDVKEETQKDKTFNNESDGESQVDDPSEKIKKVEIQDIAKQTEEENLDAEVVEEQSLDPELKEEDDLDTEQKEDKHLDAEITEDNNDEDVVVENKNLDFQESQEKSQEEQKTNKQNLEKENNLDLSLTCEKESIANDPQQTITKEKQESLHIINPTSDLSNQIKDTKPHSQDLQKSTNSITKTPTTNKPRIFNFTDEEKLTGLAHNYDETPKKHETTHDFGSSESIETARKLMMNNLSLISSTSGYQIILEESPQTSVLTDKMLWIKNDLRSKPKMLKNATVLNFNASMVSPKKHFNLNIFVTEQMRVMVKCPSDEERTQEEFEWFGIVQSTLKQIKKIQEFNKSAFLGNNHDIVPPSQTDMDDKEKVQEWLKRVYLGKPDVRVNAVENGLLNGQFQGHDSKGFVNRVELKEDTGIQVKVSVEDQNQVFYFKKSSDSTLQYMSASPEEEGVSYFNINEDLSEMIEPQEVPEVSEYSSKMQRIYSYVKSQKRIHFIFMLDQSNSIKDDGHFEDIQKALKSFLKKLKKRQKETHQKILISVITFSHLFQIKERARRVEKLKLAFLKDFLGGNTNFKNPLDHAVTLFNDFKEEVDVTLAYLFTDGDADVPKDMVPKWGKLLRSQKHFMQLRLVTLDKSVSLKRFDRGLDTPACVYLEKVSTQALFDNIKEFLSLS